MRTLQQVEPRIPIPPAGPFPIVISSPGSYFFTDNITVTAANTNGIVINANDVSIDLSGFTLRGQGNTGTTGSGIIVTTTNALSGITIQNGTVTNWRNYGIDLRGFGTAATENNVSGVTIRNIRAISNSVGQPNTNWFAGVRSGTRGTVENCVFSFNVNNGLMTGDHMTVRNNVASNNGRNGMVIASNCYVHDNVVSLNTRVGIYLQFVVTPVLPEALYNRIERNQASENLLIGIEVDGDFNVLLDNTAMNNGDTGFHIDGDLNEISGNRSIDNGDFGYFVTEFATQNLIVGNRALFNGIDSTASQNFQQATQTGNSNRYGSIIATTGGGTFTTAEPFANFYWGVP